MTRRVTTFPRAERHPPAMQRHCQKALRRSSFLLCRTVIVWIGRSSPLRRLLSGSPPKYRPAPLFSSTMQPFTRRRLCRLSWKRCSRRGTPLCPSPSLSFPSPILSTTLAGSFWAEQKRADRCQRSALLFSCSARLRSRQYCCRCGTRCHPPTRRCPAGRSSAHAQSWGWTSRHGCRALCAGAFGPAPYRNASPP